MKIEEILAVKHLSVEFQTSDGKKSSSNKNVVDFAPIHLNQENQEKSVNV